MLQITIPTRILRISYILKNLNPKKIPSSKKKKKEKEASSNFDESISKTRRRAASEHYFWYSGFWAPRQPNPQSGECVDVALTDDRQTWELTTCESLLPFMCRANACPAGKLSRYFAAKQAGKSDQIDEFPPQVRFTVRTGSA